MQIAPLLRPPSSAIRGADALAAPVGWKPEQIVAVPARRHGSSLRGMWDALRGVEELGNGQPLSPVQVRTLGAFLADEWHAPAAQTLADLEQVRFYVGGPAARRPFLATQVDHAVYVGSPQGLDRILDWEGRRWLVHELGHVMQWRRADAETQLGKTRRSTAEYVVGSAIAVPTGAARWLHGKFRGSAQTLRDAIHDAHPMERETEEHAQSFLRQPVTDTLMLS